MGWQEFFKGLFKADINAKVADTVQTGDGDTFKGCTFVINLNIPEAAVEQDGKKVINPEKLSQDKLNMLLALLNSRTQELPKGETIVLTTKDNNWAEDIRPNLSPLPHPPNARATTRNSLSSEIPI